MSEATHQQLATCHHVDTLVSYNQHQLLSSPPYYLHLAIHDTVSECDNTKATKAMLTCLWS